jgi:hypothetical protein
LARRAWVLIGWNFGMTNYVERGSMPPHLIDDGDPPAIATLKEEHQFFRALFDLVETVDGRALLSLAGEICIRLAIHMAIEEELFYPTLKPVIGADQIDEGLVEHQVAKRLISEITGTTGREELFRTKLHVLGEETVHHIDGEDCELFRDARDAWEDGKVDLVELGAQMQSRRRDLFDLVGSVAADTRCVELKSVGEAIEPVPQSSTQAVGTLVEENV